ncbi:MAG TPA: carboxypeptidase-like regulatory domain-containing protein, partial [Pirellulales bacterium]|nr:carboxypeptidase-like regulatory domain-containing protein [Pirellulales bacterium]
ALIEGGEGNSPVRDPGWPKGADAIFNTQSCIAYWVGPPFGGGQWHAECRGDAKALNAVLADFAKLDVKSKRIVLHDGIGHSFWLNANNEPAKREAAKIDWIFMIWQPANWQRLRQLPADLNPADAKDTSPPSQIDVYTGGNIRWADVTVPKGLKVVDQRLEAHGFTLADGAVLEGKVTDLATKKAVAAKVRLQRVEPQPNSYRYVNVAEADADADGHWVLKKTPAGWHRVLVEAAGYVPRVAGYVRHDGQPKWKSFDGGLARPGTVSGRVVDEAGKPLPGVDVRIQDVTAADGGRYESPLDATVKSDKDGRFKSDQVPVGRATIWVHKSGYCRPGLGEPIATPKNDIELQMMKAARVLVTVDFTDRLRPQGYIVQIAPEGGDRVGTFGGSGNIDANNQIVFENVPPGRYTFQGRPNPSSGNQETEAVTIPLRGGETSGVTLKAK